MKVEPIKVGPSTAGLCVGLHIDAGATSRFAMVTLPWEWLLDRDVLGGLDRATRRALVEQWSGVELDQPLF